mmetsp:Transcript_31959/g.68027  ORF Transcript_31959/g.68027 Transcript_31959/m.68027 type:complete len:137 (+) Transcript_31959:85-495(+)|eukprot:CAMPEP_0180491726 /NCGR_PEP_ID=MMETSP1036_2-20121128/39801_1 /TAXON_ID=632150 /ORGANISM="Azadinium spinosum, Strain 3D9" /LENGTH=136 /DNA_ID=CAMNT_0022500003 /DNA_START=76 /DNA_END=486 /DNA_ORIENTATION=+
MGQAWVPIVCLLLIVFAIVCFFLKSGGLSEVLKWDRQHADASDPNEHANAAEAEVIGASTIERCFPVLTTCSTAQCAVCLFPVEEEQPCRKLQCEHVFHAECISQWWIHAQRFTLECPVCREQQNLELSHAVVMSL